MGKPGYEVTAGSITLDGVDLVGLAPWQRARAGCSSSAVPVEVPGVQSVNPRRALAPPVSPRGGRRTNRRQAPRLGLDDMFFTRALNVDLSVGKEAGETCSLAGCAQVAVLDELDRASTSMRCAS